MEIKQLEGIKYWIRSKDNCLMVCAWCCGKKENGEWNHHKLDLITSEIMKLEGRKDCGHGMCRECSKKYF